MGIEVFLFKSYYVVDALLTNEWLASSNGLDVEADDFLVFIICFLMAANSCLVLAFFPSTRLGDPDFNCDKSTDTVLVSLGLEC